MVNRTTTDMYECLRDESCNYCYKLLIIYSQSFCLRGSNLALPKGSQYRLKGTEQINGSDCYTHVNLYAFNNASCDHSWQFCFMHPNVIDCIPGWCDTYVFHCK